MDGLIMARHEQRWWTGDPGALSRSARVGGAYRVYRPDLLAERRFAFEPPTSRLMEDAALALADVEASLRVLSNTESLGRLLLRAEAVGSSRIEGLSVGPRKLLHAEYARTATRDSPTYDTAWEVLGNVDALTVATQQAVLGQPLTVEAILATHRALLERTRDHGFAGNIRTAQNWIGGAAPPQAAFVPPPPEDVQPLLDDLVAFVNGAELPAVATAAVAHAQFETIHPFADGNGRTGRALIHMVLRQKGLIGNSSPPVSLILATHAQDYIAALTAFRHDGPPDAATAVAGPERWVNLFARATIDACDRVMQFEHDVRDIQAAWQRRLRGVRRDSAAYQLLDELPSAPVLSAKTVQTLTGRSAPAAQAAIMRLTEAGILHQVTIGRRNRAYEASELIQALTLLERRLASPDGDTRIAPPSRPAPAAPAALSDDVRRIVSRPDEH